jgi:acyl-CoA synthetase (NDP forming)
MTTADGSNQSLSALFRPRSIAVFGASDDPTRVGGRPIANMIRHGFAGPIYPINPKYPRVQGLPAYAELATVPGPVDLAIFAIPASLVEATLEDCAARGVRVAIVFSSGYAEMGAKGEAAQSRITALTRRTGLRVLGPNCLGMINVAAGAICTFGQGPAFDMPPAGGISIVSQSGAFGTFTLAVARDRGLPVAFWAATGNEADIEFADCVDWLCDDPETQVIMGYMEGCRNGLKLVRALEKAHCVGKPVVVMKVGRTEIGAAAAHSHTSALAGTDAIYDAVFRQYGAHRAVTVDEFFDVGYAALCGLLPKGRKLGIMTISGGAGVLMADAAAEVGLELPPVPATIQTQMREMVPFSAPRNPVDITGQIANDRTLYRRFGKLLMGEGGFDALSSFHATGGQDPAGGANILDSWRELRQSFPAMPVFLSMKATPALCRDLEALKIPVFEEPTRAVRAVAALCHLAEPIAVGAELDNGLTAAIPAGALSESAASALLAAAGIPMVTNRVTTSVDAAVAAADALGYPVALKVVSPDIAHKSDIGGVRLDLAESAAVAAAYDAVLAAARERQPKARIEGVMVAPMVRGGVEAVIGVHEDPTFGPIVMVGLGGVLVEVLKDVAFRRAPFDLATARRMIDELRCRALLDGVRGRPPCDIDALAEALARLSHFAAANAGRLQCIEINPLLVRPEGQGVLGLDALAIGKKAR